MILQLPEVKEWLRVDGNDDDSTLGILIKASEDYLKNATGKTFDDTNNQAKLFCLVLITDWFENRELIGKKPSEKVRESIKSILLQLQYVEANTEGTVNE